MQRKETTFGSNGRFRSSTSLTFWYAQRIKSLFKSCRWLFIVGDRMTYRTGWNDERFGSGDLLLGQLVYKRMSERAAISAGDKIGSQLWVSNIFAIASQSAHSYVEMSNWDRSLLIPSIPSIDRVLKLISIPKDIWEEKLKYWPPNLSSLTINCQPLR